MTKRRMMFVPEVNSTSFVFFFERGNSGTSWSIRDYSIKNRSPREYGPHNLGGLSADDIHLKAQYSFDAPAVRTEDLAFWHKKTEEFNGLYLGKAAVAGSVVVVPPTKSANSGSRPEPSSSDPGFPCLNLRQLQEMPKGRKTQDMDRILHSANSEDWVTWNFFRILLRQYPSGWWGHLVSAARRRNLELTSALDYRALPALKLWTSVRSPLEYEARSRARMLTSQNPEWVSRAQAPDPVEGASEIDIAFEEDRFLVFVEAKLGSDVSTSTRHDPERNQIVRNIDCLIDQAGDRVPVFWLLVRDEEPSRAYVQLVASYKNDPILLARELPHRSEKTLADIARNLTIVRWSDLKELVCTLGRDQEENAVKQELKLRIVA
jgi:hypothetical protein